MFCFVIGVRQQEVGEVDGAAGDVDRLKGVDECLGETLDIVVVWRADDESEGGLRLREEVLGDLGSCHLLRWCRPRGGINGRNGRERNGESGDRAVVSVVAGVWKINNESKL